MRCAFGWLAWVALGGCAIYTSHSGIAGSGGGGSGNALSFLWSFGDASQPLSCSAAGVTYVEIFINGLPQPLATCEDASGIAGATISGLPLGPTNWELRGEDIDQKILFDGSGKTTVVGGDTAVQLVLPPIPAGEGGTPPASLTFLWAFGGQTCAAAGVEHVQVLIPDTVTGADVDASVPCTGSNGVDGVTIGGFAAGTYVYTLSATGADGGYGTNGAVQLGNGPSPVLAIELQRD